MTKQQLQLKDTKVRKTQSVHMCAQNKCDCHFKSLHLAGTGSDLI